jgi:hypothetical protein
MSPRQSTAGLPGILAELDEAAILAHVEQRFAAARRGEDPLPHIVIENIFPEAFYRCLARSWPDPALFRRDKAGRKYDLVPAPLGADARSAGYDLVPVEQRAVWDFLVTVVNRRIVAPLLTRMFEVEIAERLAQVRRAFEAGLITYPMAGTHDWTFRPNTGRLMMRGRGHELKPHVDSMPYLVTVLHYFPDDEGDDHSGTILYKAEAPLEFEACVRDGSTQYFHEAGIACHEVMRVPFRPNMLVAFPNSLDAAHGAVAPSERLRKVFQYHISLKGDDEKV